MHGEQFVAALQPPPVGLAAYAERVDGAYGDAEAPAEVRQPEILNCEERAEHQQSRDDGDDRPDPPPIAMRTARLLIISLPGLGLRLAPLRRRRRLVAHLLRCRRRGRRGRGGILEIERRRILHPGEAAAGATHLPAGRSARAVRHDVTW